MCARILFTLFLVSLIFGSAPPPVHGVNHYTPKQLQALATRVGKTYWVVAIDGKTPPFLSAPSATAPAVEAKANDSFETTELVTGKTKDPYYKVIFESGAEGYIKAELFLEEFNARIVTLDPLAEEKKKAAQEKERERARVAWIQKQPWPRAVKEAALKGQAAVGMNTQEVKGVKGDPERVIKVKDERYVSKEQWIYGDGSVLVFTNGLLTEVEIRKTGEN